MISKILNKIFSINNDQLLNNQIKTISLLGSLLLNNKRKSYESYKSLNEAELKIFSQNGEDGIIDFLLERLSVKNPKFVEIGVENYNEANTRFLYETRNSTGLILDNSFDLKKLNINLWMGRIKAIKNTITTENINQILQDNNFYQNIDLFSIDIDGIDYWILNKLPNKISKIFICEYNPLFGSKLEITVPNIKKFDRTKYHYSNLCWGASLMAIISLMKKKGYVFLGTNLMKNNAFFILEDFKSIFSNLKISSNLFNYVNHNYMESRDKNFKLNYLNRLEQLNEIKDCEIINIEDNEYKLIKIKDLKIDD